MNVATQNSANDFVRTKNVPHTKSLTRYFLGPLLTYTKIPLVFRGHGIKWWRCLQSSRISMIKSVTRWPSWVTSELDKSWASCIVSEWGTRLRWWISLLIKSSVVVPTDLASLKTQNKTISTFKLLTEGDSDSKRQQKWTFHFHVWLVLI